MKRIITIVMVLGLLVALAPAASATNGDNLIAIGPIARAMGGVGIAAPQDAISAVFSNPAGMCFGPYCPGSEVNFAGTLFIPSPEAKITSTIPGPGGTLITRVTKSDSDDKVYAIPAFGLSWPITEKLRFGLAAFGVSGLGVDYRDTDIENPAFYDFNPLTSDPRTKAPLVAGEYTQLQIMKFSPNLAYQVNDNFSLGLGVHIDYSALDFRNGSSFNYSAGVQVGALYKPTDIISIGVTYTTPQSVDHENVVDFDQDGTSDDLDLEIPQEVGIGIAVEPMGAGGKLLFEVNGKWLNWSSADGYDDFDWDDQYVVAVGAQFKPTEKLALRAGYNFGENPVEEHKNFDGSFNPLTGAPNDAVKVQGKNIPRYFYETFRIIGFPAIVEHHATAGIGYEFNESFAINLAYTHAFDETISESGTNPFGLPVELESSLEEDSIEFGLTWRF